MQEPFKILIDIFGQENTDMMLGKMMQYCSLYTIEEKGKFVDDILVNWDEQSELHQTFVKFGLLLEDGRFIPGDGFAKE